MTRPASLSQAELARAIKAAEACGKVAAWTGHKTLADVEHYTREYDRMKAVMG